MFLIDKPFVSDFLLQTIRKNNYPVVSSPVANEMLDDPALKWIPEEEAARILAEDPLTPLYSNSENALAWIAEHRGESHFSQQAELFKDKAGFRELIREFYPAFFFKTIGLKEIQAIDPAGLNYPFVIKPSVGFFSIGVHVVRNKTEWDEAQRLLNIRNLSSAYPKNVLDTSTFIMEEYITGEEYAVDCYFNSEGEVVILNILHHRFSSGEDTSDRVYTTSKTIIRENEEAFASFLQKLGRKTGLKNFPAHVELRINESGMIIPIEINPLRFGGWCTTADLLGICLDYNSYEYYQQGLRPEWDRVFAGKEEQNFSIIVLNNSSTYQPEEIRKFDYELLAADFEKAHLVRKMDVAKYSVFGFVFAETSPGNEEELNRILVSDLHKYISPR